VFYFNDISFERLCIIDRDTMNSRVNKAIVVYFQRSSRGESRTTKIPSHDSLVYSEFVVRL